MYDIVIIGSGVSGVFTAMGLLASDKKILIIDKGKALPERIKSEQLEDFFAGFGGLGISEGKYNFTNDFGGELAEKIGEKRADAYAKQVEKLLNKYGGQQVATYLTGNVSWRKEAEKLGFEVLETKTKHLGRKNSIRIFENFYQQLKSHVTFAFEEEVARMQKKEERFSLSLRSGKKVCAEKVIVATGKAGQGLLENITKTWNLDFARARLDLGLRLEMHAEQLDQLLQKDKEIKLRYQDMYTYCMNKYGNVILKRQEGLVMPDGQNYLEAASSDNLNVTLFIPKYFSTEEDASNYLHKIIGAINRGTDRIIASRLASFDPFFKQTTKQVKPTLLAEFGNLSEEVPSEYLEALQKFLRQLQKLVQTPIDGNTIIYGMDSKLYTSKIATNDQFETNIANLYLIGDCSGVTSSLSQAAASGLYLADQLL